VGSNPAGVFNSLSCECCVFWGRVLCDELISIDVWVVLRCVLFCILVWIHNRKYKVSVWFFKDNQSSDPISVVSFKNSFYNIFSYLHLSFTNIIMLQIISTCSYFLISSYCRTSQCAFISSYRSVAKRLNVSNFLISSCFKLSQPAFISQYRPIAEHLNVLSFPYIVLLQNASTCSNFLISSCFKLSQPALIS